MNNYAIIVAAGKSERFGDKLPKQFHQVAGKPLLSWTIAAFECAGKIDQVVIVTSEEYLAYVTKNVIDPFDFTKVCKVVKGGANRKESVFNGLKSLPDATRVVAIHDGVRPLVSSKDINRVVDSAEINRAAMLAEKSQDTVKEVKQDVIVRTLDRSVIWLAQTPQAFEYKLILEAHADSLSSDSITDDALLVERMGISVKVIEPSSSNIKVTTAEDMIFVEAVLEKKLK